MQKRSSPSRSGPGSPTRDAKAIEAGSGSYSAIHTRNLSLQGYSSQKNIKQAGSTSEHRSPLPEKKEYPRLTTSSRRNDNKSSDERDESPITTGRFKEPEGADKKHSSQIRASDNLTEIKSLPTESENKPKIKLDLDKIAASVSSRIDSLSKSNYPSTEGLVSVETEKTDKSPKLSQQRQASLISNSSDDKNVTSKDSGSSSIRRQEYSALSMKAEEEKAKSTDQIEQLKSFQSEIKGLVKNISHNKQNIPPLPTGKKPFVTNTNPNTSTQDSPTKKQIYRHKQQMSLDSRNSPHRVSYREQQQNTNDLYRRKIFNSLSQQELESLNLQKNLDVEGSTEFRQKLMNTSSNSLLRNNLSVISETKESLPSNAYFSPERSDYDSFQRKYYSPLEELPVNKEDLREYSGEKQFSSISGAALRSGPINSGTLDYSRGSVRRSLANQFEKDSKHQELEEMERKDKFFPLTQWIKDQIRGNPKLEEALDLLLELHDNEIKISDNQNKAIRAKYDQLYDNNKLLINTLQGLEKELDSLVQHNKRLDTLVSHYEKQIQELENQNRDFQKVILDKEIFYRNEIDRIKEDCHARIQKINCDIDVLHERYQSMRSYNQYCESTIAAINVTLRKLLAKASYKIANPRLAGTLESIIKQTENFVDDSRVISKESEPSSRRHHRCKSQNASMLNTTMSPKSELLQRLLHSPKKELLDSVKKSNRELILNELVSASSKLNNFLKDLKSSPKKIINNEHKYKSANNSPAPSKRTMSAILQEERRKGGRSLNASMDAHHRSNSPHDNKSFDLSYQEYL